MKGAAAGNPGQVIIADYPEPVAGDQDLIVETLACGICSTDLKLVQKGAKDTRYALGHELVGKIVQAPQNSQWKVGQHVAVAPYLPCGSCYFCRREQYTLCTKLFEISYAPGGLAERILVPAEMAERGMILVPQGLSDELAALAEPLGCALKGLEDSHLQPGDALLVIGDGPMGQLVAAAGKAMGAGLVIMAGMTAHRLATARKNYADLAIDVSQDDLHQAVWQATGQRGADVVMVAVSSGEALETGIGCVRPGGEVNMFAGVPEGTQMQLDVRKVHYQQYHLTGSFGTSPIHMRKAFEMLQAEKVDFSPILSARFPFTDVADAVHYMQNYEGLKAMVTFSQLGG
ncbi:MAG: alcohol dehydrogenase catalytic domain-containing protein [Anaerolineaceae bacterium]|nr:alcohol dehydrogenase catalytic domain-containing protein [Anaerolineaceae bacterium]